LIGGANAKANIYLPIEQIVSYRAGCRGAHCGVNIEHIVRSRVGCRGAHCGANKDQRVISMLGCGANGGVNKEQRVISMLGCRWCKWYCKYRAESDLNAGM